MNLKELEHVIVSFSPPYMQAGIQIPVQVANLRKLLMVVKAAKNATDDPECDDNLPYIEKIREALQDLEK